MVQQQAAEQRLIRKEEKARKQEEMNKLKEADPVEYIRLLYEKRKHIKDKIRKIKVNKDDFNIRKNKNQRMLKIIDSFLDKKEDENSKADADLENLNKEINTINSDIENYESKLQEVENELREVDPSFEEESVLASNMFRVGSTIEFSSDAIRPVEVLFQPYLVGNDQVAEVCNSDWALGNDHLCGKPVSKGAQRQDTEQHLHPRRRQYNHRSRRQNQG